MNENGEPNILAFLCNWCSYAGADLAGVSRLQMPTNFRVIRVMCSSRVDPEIILYAFKKGIDGILVLGCHPGDCHYINGNYKTERRMIMLQKLLGQFGINPKRLKLGWVSASEGARFQEIISSFAREMEELGKLELPITEVS